MKTIIINRDKGDDNHQLGVCYVVDQDSNEVVFKSESIERGWLDNERNVSCIPTGMYLVKKEYSPRFKKDLWEIYDVPNRSECKFHAANYARQLNGCIALGETRLDIDKDGQQDVTNSKETMRKFDEAMGEDKRAFVIITNIIEQHG